MALLSEHKEPQRSARHSRRALATASITFLPLVWLLAVTMTAGIQKIADGDSRIGFLAQARALDERLPALSQNLAQARAAGTAETITKAENALKTNRVLRFNALLDAAVTFAFLLLVSGVVALSFREWFLLWERRKPVVLCETDPVWLPEAPLAQARPLNVAGLAVLGVALAKELSGEAELARSQTETVVCSAEKPGVCHADREARPKADAQRYLEMTERRFTGVRRCC
jgi:carbon starvation protein